MADRQPVFRYQVNRAGVTNGPRASTIKKVEMINIVEIARECPGTIIAVRAEDLVEANNRLIDKVRSDLEKELAQRQGVTYMTRDEVIEKLSVAPSTLWRWQKRGYLVPVKVGGENRYRSTDIDRILEGEI